jgi:hypothetical protein
VTLKHLPDGSVDLYGFYTGGKSDWQNVPVIRAYTILKGTTLVSSILKLASKPREQSRAEPHQNRIGDE